MKKSILLILLIAFSAGVFAQMPGRMGGKFIRAYLREGHGPKQQAAERGYRFTDAGKL